jgi:hypothetical protein
MGGKSKLSESHGIAVQVIREALILNEDLTTKDLLGVLARHGLTQRPGSVETVRQHVIGTLRMMREMGISWEKPRPRLRRPGVLPAPVPHRDRERLRSLEVRLRAVESKLAASPVREAAE